MDELDSILLEMDAANGSVDATTTSSNYLETPALTAVTSNSSYVVVNVPAHTTLRPSTSPLTSIYVPQCPLPPNVSIVELLPGKSCLKHTPPVQVQVQQPSFSAANTTTTTTATTTTTTTTTSPINKALIEVFRRRTFEKIKKQFSILMTRSGCNGKGMAAFER